MAETTAEKSEAEVEQLVETIKNDRSKALRAEKTVSGSEDVENPRTAVRYVEDAFGHAQFEVVSTRVRNFPLGTDNVQIKEEGNVKKWVAANDPEVIDAADEDGFEFETEEEA